MPSLMQQEASPLHDGRAQAVAVLAAIGVAEPSSAAHLLVDMLAGTWKALPPCEWP